MGLYIESTLYCWKLAISRTRGESVVAVYRYQDNFYPTALKGCPGIVFTHGVQMGGWREKFVRPVS